MASLSTFETLPDEILITIFRYSGDTTYSIFRSYIGLNQRINNILVDQRSQILSSFLNIKNDDVNFNNSYQSPFLQTLCHELCTLREDNSEARLGPLLEKLLGFHMQEQCRRYEQEFVLNRQNFESIRSSLSTEEIRHRDAALKQCFHSLQHSMEVSKCLRQLETLIVNTGARLECDDHEIGHYNLAQAINQHFLSYTSLFQRENHLFHDRFIKVVKAMIISNPILINNRDYVGNGGYPVYFFFVHVIYLLRDFYTCSSIPLKSTRKFQIVLDLFLFIIQCLKHRLDDRSWAMHCLEHSLRYAKPIENDTNRRLIIQTNQLEILKILLKALSNIDIVDNQPFWLLAGFHNLVTNHRFDMIMILFRCEHFMKQLIHESNNRHIINKMTGSHNGRRLFEQILDDQPLVSWLSSTNVFFLLLAKKEFRLIKKLIHVQPILIHQLDADGNDPLLYLCLRVHGCRYRFVEFFITVGCDTKRRNSHGEDFIQAIQLKRNRHLLKKLIDHEIITIRNEIEQSPRIVITFCRE